MTLCLLAQLTLRLIPASAENLLIDFSEFFRVFFKYQYFFRNNSVLEKIRGSLFCVTNHCSKVLRFYNTSKRVLSSLSEYNKTNFVSNLSQLKLIKKRYIT